MKNRSNTKNAMSLLVYLSKVGDKLFVALDGNRIDFNDFGIDDKIFHEIGIDIDRVFQKYLNKGEIKC